MDRQSAAAAPLPVRWIAAFFGRYARTIDWIFLTLFLAIFLYAVADWRGWLPFERGFQPLRMVYLGAALVLQPAGSLVQRRSMPLGIALMIASMGVLALAFFGFGAAHAASQTDGCADGNWPSLQASDPAYEDAMALARTLGDRGFTVRCIAPSKMTGTFAGQKGAALFRTNRGNFEALFLPKPQTFDHLDIVERKESGRYLYSFSGRPAPWPANLIDGPRPTFFIKHMNRLVVAQDKATADALGAALECR